MAGPNDLQSLAGAAAQDIFSGQAAIGARSSVMSVADRNPDAEAKVQSQAQSLGVPYESARNNPQVVTQRAAANAVDYDNLARTAPVTTRFLGNPANAAVSHDDVGALGGIEHWIANTGSYIGQKFISGLHSVAGVGAQALNDLYTNLPRMADPYGFGTVAQAGIQNKNPVPTQQEAATQARVNQGMGLQRFAIGQQQTAQRISQRADQEQGYGDTAYATTNPDQSAFLHPTKIVGDIFQGLPTLAALFASTYLSKGEGAAALGGYFGLGQQLDTLTNLPDAEIKKSPAYRSLINAGVDPASASAYVRGKTAGDQGIVSGGINAALAGMAGKLVSGGSLWKGIGLDALTWGAMGGASQLGANAVEKADVNPDKSLTEGVGEAFASNAAQGGLFHVIGHGIVRSKAVSDAEQTHQAIKDFTDLAAASKLRERAPGTFHDLVETMADGSPVENVYVAPDKMVEAMDALHQGEIEPDKMAAIENAVGPKLKDALEQGTDVELPLADYATHLAGTGADKVLLDHLKVDPNGMTKAEAEEFMQTKGEELQKEVERTLQQVGNDDDRAREVQQVKRQVLEQLNSANRFTPQVNDRYADLHAAFYSTLADRLGVSPNTLYERYPVRIVNKAMSDSEAQLHQRYNDLLSNIGKVPEKPKGAGNDTGHGEPGAFESLKEFMLDPAPTHQLYREGDFLNYKGESGEVIGTNDKSVTLKLPSGERIVPRDHPDLDVAPIADWKVPDDYKQSDKPIFYSELERAVEKTPQAKASGQQWLATLAKTAGVKKEEIEWTELPEWLGTQEGPVTREELLAFVREGGVQVEEVDRSPITSQLNDRSPYLYPAVERAIQGANSPSTHFDEKGVVAHMRFKTRETTDGKRTLFIEEVQSDWHQKGRDQGYEGAHSDEAKIAAERDLEVAQKEYTDANEALGHKLADAWQQRFDSFSDAAQQSRWAEANPQPGPDWTVASLIRETSSYPDTPGVEEALQRATAARLAVMERDQAARDAGAKTGIPDAPFKATWPALVMKRAIRWAVDNGFEAVAWTTGDQQRERYNLAQHVGQIEVQKRGDRYRVMTPDNAHVIRAITDRGMGAFPEEDVGRGGVMMSPEQIGEVFGKDLGGRMMAIADQATAERTMSLYGDDLKIGGEGMNAFYDRNLVNITNGILKKLGGAKVEPIHVEGMIDQVLGEGSANPGFHITPEIAQHAREGFALFQKNRGAYSPATDTISLLEHADLSTFLHESGHFFLETYSRMVENGNAPQQINDDFNAFLKWADVKDASTWASMTLEQRREAHEKFAQAFEAYLFTGKAPAPRLRELFRTFRSWLVAVYKHVTSLGVKPNAEIAGVMDRMLASDEEIKQAQAARSMEPLFESQAQSGMSEDQWRDYQRTNASATEEAQSTLTARSLRDMKWLDNARSKEVNRLQRQAQGIRKATRAEVEAQVAAEPVYRAQRFLKRGTVDGEQVEGPHRLGIAHVDALGHTPETKAKLGYGKYGMLGEQGLHPDEVADRFGFSSGDHLIKSLAGAEPFKDRVNGLTEQRLLEEHGDLTDPQSINEAASEAVHNEFRARAVAAELAALAKATGKPKILAQAARQFAEQSIARTRVKDLKPAKYEAAAARAGKAAMQALAKGDQNLAAMEKRNQLFNTYAVKAARDALADVQRAVDHFNKLQRPSVQANMRGPFRQQLAALLDRFDLRSSVPLKASTEPLKPLNEWVQEEAERLSAVLPAIPDFILNPGFKTHYRSLTIEQMRGLADSVKQIEMLARREQKQYMALKGMAFDAEREKLLDAVRKSYPQAFDGITGNPLGTRPDFVPSFGKALGKTGDKFIGEFLSTETLASMLDGGVKGAAHDSLFSRMSERSDWKSEQMAQIAKDFKPLFKQWNLLEKRAYARKGYFIDSIGMSMTRENMLVTALLAGSTDGRQRLNNYGWTDPHIDDIVSRLDERDWKLADAIWRLFDEKLWPQMYDLNMRTRGVAPPKVEAYPYQTKFGTARGGYFRLKYDTELDERAQRMDEGQQVKDLLGGTLGMGGAKTNQGTSIERVDNVTMRPRLDLGVFNETVNETLHDLAYREAVADTMRVLNDKQVQAALKGSLGTPGYRAFVAHVRDVAAPPRNPMGWVEKAISVARRNTIINMMSGVVTALVHLHGIVPAFTRINTGLLAAEIAKSAWLPHTIDRYRFASQTSQFMAQRTSNLDRDMAKNIDRLTMKGRLMPGSEVFLGLMTHIHKGIDAVVWNAAFKEGMKLHANNSDEAVAHADHIVRQTQGSGRDVDLPSIMAGHGGWGELKKAFTMFSSYFNSQLQLLVQSGAVAKQEARDNPALASAKFAAKFMMISIVPGLLYEALFSSDTPDEGETAEGKALRYLHAVVEYNAGFVPILRDIVPEVWAQFDHAEPDYGYKISPLQSAGEAVFQKAPHSAVKAAQGAAETKDIHNLIVAGGFLTGTPGKLLADVVSGTNAWASGQAGPEAIALGPNHARKAGQHF